MAENQWITEALVQFSESPIWMTPIENFVDENCCVFSNDSEMKLEYTVVHNNFKKLVDSLLTCCVEELGVSMQMAVDALERSLTLGEETPSDRTERDAAKKMMKQILNADNFAVFHATMVKRNLELDILANAALRARGIIVGGEEEPETGVDDGNALVPARMQRVIDANGNIDEDEALRCAIEESLHDSAARQQVQAYSEVCVREEVVMKVAAVELQASRQKAQLKAVIQSQASPESPEVERYRQEQMSIINQQKESQIQQIHNCAMLGVEKHHVLDEAKLPTAEFSSPEVPQAVLAPPCVPAATSAPASAPLDVPVSAPTMPPMGQRQSALPGIASKTDTGATRPALSAPAPLARGNAVPATSASTLDAISREEMDRRAEYMREQREKILARNRASRQEQLDMFVKKNSTAETPSSSETGAAVGTSQAMTIEIARRLRGDLLGEARKKNS
ncbi:hypothetical protein JKF63_00130 [Porcisia hertigi]|uniref:Cilia- and flagella-associated protein 36 n=1 Tax=Porcisia hertigi TaxID=2761500 RepID=A0A836KWT6_9TRYP|nr:hypothetical protein JKF63_00130 [Porcisia hertigi]